ncbi:MAG: hypothetical protein N3G21_00750 [Candidatus Hydrogenedentes bacterium]|nr:hypothetical protein [Candidatus Hydrogenedentota bacterium]
MRIKKITFKPVLAQQSTNFCANPQSDYQAFLCFLLNVLVNFFLPLAEIKKPQEPGSETTTT